MVYKHNSKIDDEHTPVWVKLLGGLIAAGIGAMLGIVIAYHGLIWYINDCEPNPQCVVNRILK